MGLGRRAHLNAANPAPRFWADFGRFWGVFFRPRGPHFANKCPPKVGPGREFARDAPYAGPAIQLKKNHMQSFDHRLQLAVLAGRGPKTPTPKHHHIPVLNPWGWGVWGGVFSDQKSGPNVEISTITQPHHMPFFATDAQRRPQSGSKIGFHFGADDAPRSAIRRKNGRARENRRTGGADFGNVVRAESRRAIRDTKCRGGEWGGQLSKSPLGIRIGAVVRELSANW